MAKVFSAVLVPDAARHDILSHSRRDDKLMDICPAATTFLEAHAFDALWATDKDLKTDRAMGKVKKIIYEDLAIFFVYGHCRVLRELFGGHQVKVSPKHKHGVHLWVLGARDATHDEPEAQYWKIFRSV